MARVRNENTRANTRPIPTDETGSRTRKKCMKGEIFGSFANRQPNCEW